MSNETKTPDGPGATSERNPTPSATTMTTTQPGGAIAPAAAPPRARRVLTRPNAPLMQTIEEAAETLQLTPEALRARCRRAVVKQADGSIVAPLAPGVVAVKLGEHWRVRFDAP